MFIGASLIGFLISNFFQKQGPEISLEMRQVDLGEREQFDDVYAYFIFENRGELPLKINDVKTRCGCTVANIPEEEILPNQKDSILVSYDAEKLGYYVKEIMVHSNAQNGLQQLYISGEIY